MNWYPFYFQTIPFEPMSLVHFFHAVYLTFWDRQPFTFRITQFPFRIFFLFFVLYKNYNNCPDPFPPDKRRMSFYNFFFWWGGGCKYLCMAAWIHRNLLWTTSFFNGFSDLPYLSKTFDKASGMCSRLSVFISEATSESPVCWETIYTWSPKKHGEGFLGFFY